MSLCDRGLLSDFSIVIIKTNFFGFESLVNVPIAYNKLQ